MSQNNPFTGLPGRLQLPDGRILVGTLMRILGKSEEGIPQEVTIIEPGTPVEMVPGDVFVIGYVFEGIFTHRA